MPRRSWTSDEDEYLLKVMSNRTVTTRVAYAAAGVYLNRSATSVACRYAELKSHGQVRSPPVVVYHPLPVATPPWMKRLTRAQLMAGR